MSTFYFYDLETSGVSAKHARIMQFAGQRTDMNLQPVGEPDNILVKLTEDVLPEPDAIMITGITPQKTIKDGVAEAEFLKKFQEEIAAPDTIFVGFNTVRFDDEFMRYALYRNFHDPYEWQWKDGRSRWDLLDMVRMTRALRPEGIIWPFDSKGKPTNRLELLASVNKLSHDNAHDALSDVYATIDLAKLVKEKQPKLFDFLLKMRDKKKIQALVESEPVFVYSSGKYDSEKQKTTIATLLTPAPQGAALVYDLSIDPKPFLKMTEDEIVKMWQKRFNDPGPKLPVKTLKYNRCPAIAPLGVLDKPSQERLNLDPLLAKGFKAQLDNSDFAKKCLAARNKLDKIRDAKQSEMLEDLHNVDEKLYDGFIAGNDKPLMSRTRAAGVDQIDEIDPSKFNDQRLKALFPLYKARNFPGVLTGEERRVWEDFCKYKILDGNKKSRLAKYMQRLQELDASVSSPEKRYLLEELQLYAESIMPLQNE